MGFIFRGRTNDCKRSNIAMGMKILKLKYHVAAFFRVLLYKTLFGGNFSVGGVQPSEGFLIFTWKRVLQ